MAQLLVRNPPDEFGLALKRRAARRNCSAEQAHREILMAAPQRPARRAVS
jgi:antitoxin FitA